MPADQRLWTKGSRRWKSTAQASADRPHSIRQWATGENGAIYDYTSDLPGNVTGLFRANGSNTTLANEYRYTPWGEAEVRQEGTPNPLRYMSREVDGGTGLYYVRNRWYDVQLGRFLSEDPIGLGGGINWYAYAANSPTNLRDPFGLEPCVITYSYKYYKDTGEGHPRERARHPRHRRL